MGEINDIVMAKILEYIENCLFEPKIYWPKHIFKDRTYARWAAYEILESISTHPFKSADETIYEFAIRMSCYSCINDGSEASHIFSIASDTADDIYQLIH